VERAVETAEATAVERAEEETTAVERAVERAEATAVADSGEG